MVPATKEVDYSSRVLSQVTISKFSLLTRSNLEASILPKGVYHLSQLAAGLVVFECEEFPANPLQQCMIFIH